MLRFIDGMGYVDIPDEKNDWYDVPSDEMTLEQARQAVKDLRKKLIEYLDQEPKTETEDSSTAKVYVVTQDGYLHSYGSAIYLVGVFTEKKEAEEAASAERAHITEIQLDKAFPLEKSNWGRVGNDYYLGGYIE